MSKAVDIKKLKIFSIDKTIVDIKFKINSSTALIGESGSGKSLTLKSILNLLPNSLNLDLIVDADFELNPTNIGFIPQNPFTSLSPMTKIKNQFFCSKEKRLQLIKLVGLEEFVLNRFPSELSGGQLQRVVIAIALSNDIKLLLLDEPTTALDNNSKKHIIDLILSLSKKLDILVLFVTHDIESIKNICDDIVIIKNGSIIESGKTIEVLENPKNIYTTKLINSSFKNKEFRK